MADIGTLAKLKALEGITGAVTKTATEVVQLKAEMQKEQESLNLKKMQFKLDEAKFGYEALKGTADVFNRRFEDINSPKRMIIDAEKGTYEIKEFPELVGQKEAKEQEYLDTGVKTVSGALKFASTNRLTDFELITLPSGNVALKSVKISKEKDAVMSQSDMLTFAYTKALDRFTIWKSQFVKAKDIPDPRTQEDRLAGFFNEELNNVKSIISQIKVDPKQIMAIDTLRKEGYDPFLIDPITKRTVLDTFLDQNPDYPY